MDCLGSDSVRSLLEIVYCARIAPNQIQIETLIAPSSVLIPRRSAEFVSSLNVMKTGVRSLQFPRPSLVRSGKQHLGKKRRERRDDYRSDQSPFSHRGKIRFGTNPPCRNETKASEQPRHA